MISRKIFEMGDVNMNKRGYAGAASAVVIIMLLSSFLPADVVADSNIKNTIKGYDKGVSWANVAPLKKITFVNFDENSYLDDYSYLAAVPTTVFYDKDGGRLFSYPLLFYQDPYPVEGNRKRSLNARQGIDYFMEDWMSYCNGELDGMTLINVPESKVKQWPSRNVIEIKGDDPYSIAADIALHDWSYSDNAIVAVVEKNFSDNVISYSNRISDSLASSKVKKKRLTLPQINIITPNFVDFSVPEEYKYIKARLWYPCFYFAINLPGFFNAVNISFPPGDPNLELFCKYNDQWMQVSATFGWNQKFGMDLDYTSTYVYSNGPWRAAITDVPTHGINDRKEPVEVHHTLGLFAYGRYGTFLEALRNNLNVKYNIDITMCPGKVVKLPENPPYGCRNVTFKLTWDNPSVYLGFSLIGPSGEEILTASEENTSGYQEFNLSQLGECQDGENYSICVFSMSNVSSEVHFDIDYSWEQGIQKNEGDSLSSATEGAVLASTLNAPLLYTSQKNLPKSTEDTLYKLGVRHIYIVDIGNNLDSEVLEKIKRIATVKRHFTTLKEVYNAIREETRSNDIVFSTIDSWSYWYVNERRPAGEYPGALFIGPAAYIAAHHGTPVLIVENHPRLSSAVVWHKEFWRRNAYNPNAPQALPSVANMYITGTRVYDILKDYGFDRAGMESIITVAGQYDIGITWDRMFFGRATPGRFFGSPVDTGYWICRNVFYPALIFVNPALDPDGVSLINGSSSRRRALFPWTKLGLVIDKPSQEEKFKYPVLQTFLCYNHRFNERGSKYWGWKYTCADGMIPGESPSFNAIDNGVRLKHEGIPGAFFPDFTSSEIIPLYLSRGGYGNVFSTNFSAVTTNLNRGVILWIGSAHGSSGDGGGLLFWDPDNRLVHENNPWRGYEWYLGSTEEPDTLTMEVYGIIPMLFGNPTGGGLTGHGIFKTAFDYAPAKKPILDAIGKIAGLPVIKSFTPEWLENTQDYYDGIVGSVMIGTLHQRLYNGSEMDDTLKNIHSAGIINGACLISTKYMHLAMMRHGSVFQVLDPWPTSWYTTWTQFIPRNLALGKTIGEAFIEGIRHVGIFYISDPPQWWADIKQNVCFFGDPDLRPYVPSTEYSDANHWEQKDAQPLRYDNNASVDGHMLYGATSHPHAYKPLPPVQILIAVILSIAVIAGVIVAIKASKSKKSGEKKRK